MVRVLAVIVFCCFGEHEQTDQCTNREESDSDTHLRIRHLGIDLFLVKTDRWIYDASVCGRKKCEYQHPNEETRLRSHPFDHRGELVESFEL